jgi:antitoxin HicB
MNNPYVGSSLNDFLGDEGIADEVTAETIVRVITWLLTQEMKSNHLTKSQMAERIGTSRAQLDRILKDDSPNVGIETLARAARAVNRELVIELR